MAGPAPGPAPILVSNPAENETSRIVGALASLTLLSLATVLARAYVRLVIIRNMGWDVSCWQSPCEKSPPLANLLDHRTSS
jgi:hypothetical protein